MSIDAILAGPWRLYWDWLPQLASAAGGTLRMTAFAFCLAAVLGLFIALARISPRRMLARAALVYIEVIRGTPLLTQLLIIYFGGASLGINLPAFHAAVLGLGLNGAAYLAEVYRSGIQAIHRGQLEAAQAIGMPRSMMMRFIVIPQAARIVLPPIANYSISLLRETSIASLIAAPELMIKARELSAEYFMPMQAYLIAGAIYLLMSYPLAGAVRYLEIRLCRGR